MNKKYEFAEIVGNIDKVKELKNSKKQKVSTSLRPLKFEADPDDSPLKAEIIRRINAKNLTYGDIYSYCTNLKDGNQTEGQKFGYNIILGLKNRHTMIDTTFSMLCDFLNLDIFLVDRNKQDDEVEDEAADE